ncbi:GH92 family glycosyl hydrolase [Sphingobacteriaceae bacterium WQ 2009]|uniref:GH92 family glycosyl hydrolase n=1 Tax=Rhinopithecimicrobium faecis TaxID=2820698 RepID=A0A8T4HCM4_9SPHI|nr:GH92 family glycosyl hydrolase [Sphingobacteriaceae bacterium WQ 2009]
MKFKVSILTLSACLLGSSLIAQEKLTSYVDPFIGTGGHGHTYPGATVPFSLVQLSPDNGRSGWDWVSGYHDSDSLIAGFSHMHLSGTGIGDWLDISVMPLRKPIATNQVATQVKFSHANEKASPGFYQVALDNGIRASLTATARVGFHRYEFPQGTQEPTLRLDLDAAYNWDKATDTEIRQLNDSTLIGYRYSKGWASVQRIYFALRTNKAITKLLLNGAPTAAALPSINAKGKGVNAQLIFAPATELYFKVALSTSDELQALAALQEIPDWNFERVKAEADSQWEAELQKIKIQSADIRTKRIFYSALYHTALSPNLFSNADGSYKNAQGKNLTMANQGQRYTLFSLWDTYRALNPLFTLTQRDRYADILNSLLAFYDENGLLPVWDLSTAETNTMTGYHAIPVLADAVLKDWPGLDAERAYKAMLASATQAVRGVPAYMKYGYVPQDIHGGSVTMTLEYAFDDYCISLVAKKLGKMEDYAVFSKRAKGYIHQFDPKTGFMRAKTTKGDFIEPFDPFYSEHDFDKSQYIEGNAWQHSFYVPHDVRGLAKLFPQKDGLEKKLDELFVAPSIIKGENTSPDMSGFIGQYAHGNEPSHQIAYMYSYLGKAYKTQEKVRFIVDSMYHDRPDGYAGNEDAGQMSAWAVWSMIGMYPVAPAGGEYVFGSPTVTEATIQVGPQKKFTIKAENNSKENIYIQSIRLNGQAYSKTFIRHEDLLKGGELIFKMGAKPNKKFGKDKATWPSSMEN